MGKLLGSLSVVRKWKGRGLGIGDSAALWIGGWVVLWTLGIVGLLLGSTIGAWPASLLPNGEQTFVDQNGAPLAGGSVSFYIPNTLTPKATWLDSGETTANTNPVQLDGAGRAVIYGSGTYRQVVKDVFGNVQWDQLTADTASATANFAGTSGGSANAQTLTDLGFTQADGQSIGFIAGFTNTGALTLSVNGGAGIQVEKDTPSGPAPLTGGEVVVGNNYTVVYDALAGIFHLVSFPANNISPVSTLASAATTDLGTAATQNISITGTNAITSFGSSASTNNPYFNLQFTGALLLTQNAASLILPGGQSIVTTAGSSAVAVYLGAGNWQVVSYTPALTVPQGTWTPGVLSGCQLTSPTTTTLGISPCYARNEDSAGAWNMVTSIAWTKSLSSWASGTGNGGLDSGSIAASTWYYVFSIINSATGGTDYLLSASASAPTMPTGFTSWRRIGAFLTNSSSQVTPFVQLGNHFLWSTSKTDLSASVTDSVAHLQTLSVPTATLDIQADFQFIAQNTSVFIYYYLSSPQQSDETPVPPNNPTAPGITGTGGSGSNAAMGSTRQTMATLNGQIRYRFATGNASTTAYIFTYGWWDTRGKD